LSSLNHFTVPVAMHSLPGRSCAAKRGRCKSNNYERWHYFAELKPGTST
jgi:hypothetical protein